MKKKLKILLSIIAFVFFENALYSQLTATSPSACPNQATVIIASWPNVASITYTIYSPVGGSTVQVSNPNFTVSSPNAGTQNYTITAQGTSGSGPVTGTTNALFTVNNPPALTVSNPINYVCYGANATFTAASGGTSYSVAGPVSNFISPINIITVPNAISPSYNGQYTITTTIAGCLRKGVTTLSVAPNNTITVNSPSAACQGGTVQLTASLPSGSGYTWFDPFSNQLTSSSQNTLLTNLQPTNTGVYTVNAFINFGTISCPRSATTSVSVVQTGPVTATASPKITFCQGETVNLSASAQGAIPQSYSWSGPQGFSSTSQNPVLTNLLPANTGAYSVSALFFSPNVSLNCYKNSIITISVIATSIPTISVPSNVCEGSNVQLSASASGAVSYSWYAPNNFSTTIQNPIVSNAISNSSGVYIVKVNFSLIAGCTVSNSAVMSVVPVNSVTVIPSEPICQPNNAFLNAYAISASSYTWAGPNNFYSSGFSSNATLFNPPTSASGVYTITAGFSNGALTCYNSNTVSLLVKPLLNFSIPSYYDQCYNSNIHVGGPIGATSYTWTSTTGYYSNDKDLDIISAQPNNTGTYSLTVSLNGCNTAAQTYINIRTPIVLNSVVPDERVVCKQDTLVQLILVSGGSENYAYTWSPDNYLSSPTGSYVTIEPLGTTVYNITIYDIACPEYSISQSFKVTVVEPPEPLLTLNKSEGCQPLEITINAKIKKGNAQWIDYDFGGKLLRIPGNNDTTFNVTFTNAGINEISYAAQAVMEKNVTCNSKENFPFTVNVLPKPGAQVNWMPQKPTVSDLITFNASSKTENTLFNWTFAAAENAEPDTASTQSLQRLFQTAGTYPFLLIAKTDNGCSDTIINFLVVEEDLNLFIPNTFTPNGDNLNDVFRPIMSGVSDEGYTMDIFNKKGIVIYSTKEPLQGWDGTYKGNKAPNDVYVYKIKVIGATSQGNKEYVGVVSLIR